MSVARRSFAFDAAADVAKKEQRSRDGGGANVSTPTRGGVTCCVRLCSAICAGTACTARRVARPPTRRVSQAKTWGRGAERAFPEHPVSIWVREESLVEGILGFFSECIFGPNRRELLEADLKRVESEADTGARRRIKSLEKSIGQLEARQNRLVRNLELDDDADGVTFRRIRERMDELENERLRKLNDLHALREEEPEAGSASPELLEHLPVGDVNLASAPENLLRRIFESFRLQVRYDKVASWATCRVVIREDALDHLLTDSSAHFPVKTNDPDGGNGCDQLFRDENS
jgi:hypothetical protein